MNCVKCGKPQGYKKNTLNWKKYQMCIHCAKREYWEDYTKLKCKKCGSGSNHTNAKCWKKYSLCVSCAKTEHPIDYKKVFRPSYYKMCPICKEYIQKLIWYKKRVIGKSSNLYVCVPCVKIFNLGSKFEILKI